MGFKESNPESFNRYAYVNNNPYRFIDPDGRQATTRADYADLLGPDDPGAKIAERAAQIGETAAAVGDAVDDIASDPTIYVGGGTLKAATLVGKAVKKGPIWASTKNKSAVENAFGHWKKHKSEFPEFKNAKQYVEGTQKFVNSPPQGTLTKTRSNGDTLLFDPKTNTFGVKDANGAPRTMFRPKDGMDYWNRQ